MTFVQGTGIAIDGRGVLLIGPPGTGKSDLALRSIGRGALLIADDGIDCSVQAYRLHIAGPDTGPRRLHVAGIGLVDVPVSAPVPLELIVECTATGQVCGREPMVGAQRPITGWACPRVTLSALEASAVDKLLLALERWGL